MSNLVDTQAAAARIWWQRLNGLGEKGRADTGGRARLRRLTPETALAEDSTIDLLRRLRRARAEAGLIPNDDIDCALAIRLALVLSHVRADSGTRFGRAIGRTSYSDPQTAVLKPIRFRRLLEAETEEDMISGIRRALQMTGCEVNVIDLARHLLTFGSDLQKRRLILDYYDAREENPAGVVADPLQA